MGLRHSRIPERHDHPNRRQSGFDATGPLGRDQRYVHWDCPLRARMGANWDLRLNWHGFSSESCRTHRGSVWRGSTNFYET